MKIVSTQGWQIFSIIFYSLGLAWIAYKLISTGWFAMSDRVKFSTLFFAIFFLVKFISGINALRRRNQRPGH